jgi:hypothetical protein
VTVAFAALAALALPASVWAHGFEERYDLPAPLGYFVAGAGATVALSFVVALLFARSAPADTPPAPRRRLMTGRFFRWLRGALRVVTLGLFILVLVAALGGTGDPLMNIAPTLVWIIWWVGFSLFVACAGNLWPLIDPWRTLFDALDTLARWLGRPEGLSLGWCWPDGLGAWPAVAFLMAWSWLEVVYPLAAVPSRLGVAALGWTALSLAGMALFGRESWQRHADMFAIYFTTLGRLAPLGRGPEPDSLEVRAPGAALIRADLATRPPPPGMNAFIIAMLATVLFDGLHGGQAWALFEEALRRVAPHWPDPNGFFSGSVGMLAVWACLYAAYAATCMITARIAGQASTATLARLFAPTLVPIAVAYNIAHNLSSLLIQGQNLLPLLSDPLGRQWNLFGTAHLHANIGLVDARLTWSVAIVAIVSGHAISIWLAHRLALREFATPRRAALAGAPLTVLMVAYTAISLLVIAEPMVTFETPVPAEPAAGR